MTEQAAPAKELSSASPVKASHFIPVVVSCLLLAAHHLRAAEFALSYLWLSAPLFLFIRRSFTRPVFMGMLLWGAAVWIGTALSNIDARMLAAEPWGRMALILFSVAAFTGASALVFSKPGIKSFYRAGEESQVPGVASFAFTFSLLAFVQFKMDPAGLLLERFVPDGGWIEAFWLSAYAGWLTTKMMEPAESARWRPRIWLFFSAVFFAQLMLGLAGFPSFLMTGKLHLPVPALIIAGPVYRGGGLFMIILFAATVLAAGPVWCSYLCYIGAWDDRFARSGGKPKPLPGWRRYARPAILAAVIAAALVLRLAGAPASLALGLASGFGIVGAGLMAYASRKTGVMVHCTSYCPIGWVATRLGKINPLRIKIKPGCNQCGACKSACRFDALTDRDIENKRPGPSCTLCGDCVHKCRQEQIVYWFPNLSPASARALFMVLAVTLHAVFLGVARP